MELILIKSHSLVDVITNSSSELYVCNGDKGFSVFKKMLENLFNELNLVMDDYVKLIDMSDKESLIQFCDDVCGWSKYYDFGLLDGDGLPLIHEHHYEWEREWNEKNNFNAREWRQKMYAISTELSEEERDNEIKKMEDENGYTEILRRRESDREKYMKEWEETKLPLILEKTKGMFAIRGKRDNILSCLTNENGVSLANMIESRIKNIKYYHLG